MTAKIGKTAKDIFAPTTSEVRELKKPGRPQTHNEEWTKVTVVLLNRQIVFLDRLSTEIRAKTGVAIKRAEIIRALVDGLDESGVDLTEVTSESDMKAELVARLES